MSDRDTGADDMRNALYLVRDRIEQIAMRDADAAIELSAIDAALLKADGDSATTDWQQKFFETDVVEHWEVECKRLYRALARYAERDDLDPAIRRDLLSVHGHQPHIHVAGTTAGLDIDECALCSRDLRHEIHRSR